MKLINGNVECTSCHDPHVQGIDRIAQNFSGSRQFERPDVLWPVMIRTEWCRDRSTRWQDTREAFIRQRQIRFLQTATSARI